MFAALILQTSTLLQPLFLGAEPPELRSARDVLLVHAGARECPPAITRSKEEAVKLATDVVARLRAGGDFARTAGELSNAPDASTGGLLGSFPRGVLAPELDAFLSKAEVGAISDPIPTARGVFVLQRIETHAAVLQIRVDASGDDGARAKERIDFVHGELERGADFGQLARENSTDRESAARGGQFAIYERGPHDMLLKAAAFALGVGEFSVPIRSPVGWHILKRVPLGSVSPSLAENNWARVSAILLQHDKSLGVDKATARSQEAAKSIADKLVARAKQGEDFAKLAAEVDDDRGGKERGGDLGWVHRGMPSLPQPIGTVFLMRVGDVALLDSSLGYVIVKRQR